MKKFICIMLSIMFVLCFSGCLDESTFPSQTPTPTNKGAVLYTPANATPTPVAEQANKPTPTEKPTATPTLKPTPTKKPTATQAPSSEVMVWIPTNGGTKYHNKPTCSSMKNPAQVTKSDAINQGFSPCGRCY